MYYTTGFCYGEIKELCALVAEIQSSIPLKDRREWPPILGLGNSVVVTLTLIIHRVRRSASAFAAGDLHLRC